MTDYNEWMSCWQCPWIIALGWKACINCSVNRQMSEAQIPFSPLGPGRIEVSVKEEP